jgi:ubiquinone biosynthesis protein
MPMKWKHIGHYRKLLRLLIKSARMGVSERKYFEPALLAETPLDPEAAARAEALSKEFEKLGPSYIKLGQFLSTRADILPGFILRALSRLQDNVEPFDYAVVERIVTSELGVRLSKAFSAFEKEPLASASLSQVHRARLRNGRQVAVKVQRPGIREKMFEDIEAMHSIAGIVDRTTRVGKRLRFGSMLDEFRKASARELDFKVEAAQMIQLKHNLTKFKRIVLPAPVQEYTTSGVLTMDYLAGRKITELTPFSRTEIDCSRLADELFAAYLHQVLINGFYHADPHPGNLLITEDHNIALIDLGMVARIPVRVQQKLLQFIFDLNQGNGDEAARHLLDISRTAYDYDEKSYFQKMNDLVAKYQGIAAGPLEIGRIVLEITKVCAVSGVIYPMDLTLLGKALMSLDQAAKILDPGFDPNKAIRVHAGGILRKRMRRDINSKRVMTAILDTEELVTMMPERLNAFLEKLANNKLSLNIEALDEKYLMTGLQKIANRLTTGLILAALIVGAALMMNVETHFMLWGYPGFAMIAFLVAGLGGLVLIFNIMFQDETTRRKQ